MSSLKDAFLAISGVMKEMQKEFGGDSSVGSTIVPAGLANDPQVLAMLQGDLRGAAIESARHEQAQAALAAAVGGGPKRRGRGRRGGLGFEPDIVSRSEGSINAELDMQFESEQRLMQLKIDSQQILDDENRAKELNIQRTREATEARHREMDTLSAYNDMVGSIAGGALQSFTAGLVDSAIASAIAGESFGTMALKMASGVLAGIARQSAVLAAFHVAQALGAQGVTWGIPNPSSVNHWAAAAKFGAVAVVAGAGATGLGIAAGAGGGGSAGGAGRRDARMPDSQQTQFGKKTKREKQTTVVNVYLGDKNNRAAALLINKQVQAQVGN